MVLHTLLGIAQHKSMLRVRSRFNCLEELHKCGLCSNTATIQEQVPEMNRDQRNTYQVAMWHKITKHAKRE